MAISGLKTIVIGKFGPFSSPDFVHTIKDRFFAAKVNPEVPKSRQLAPVSMDAIKKAVFEAYGVTEDALAASARGVANDPRDIAIYLARTLKGDSLEQIGDHFDIEKKYSTVGNAIARVQRKSRTI